MVTISDDDLIPPQFYEESWEDVNYPLACVDLDNRFIRVNSAFERLLGYSSSELENEKWIRFTKKEHVGGDLKSVQAVVDGRIDSYQMEKTYIHKRGHEVPVVLTVRRYPKNSGQPLLFFRVEAPFAMATRPELNAVEHHAMQAIASLKKQLELMEGRGITNIHNRNGTSDHHVTSDHGSTARIGNDIQKPTGLLLSGCVIAILIAILLTVLKNANVLNP